MKLIQLAAASCRGARDAMEETRDDVLLLHAGESLADEGTHLRMNCSSKHSTTKLNPSPLQKYIFSVSITLILQQGRLSPLESTCQLAPCMRCSPVSIYSPLKKIIKVLSGPLSPMMMHHDGEQLLD
jgi:hypothetical protein